MIITRYCYQRLAKPIAMASFKQVLLFILICFIKFSTTKAMDNIGFSSSCSGNKTTPNSSFQLNLKTLFSYLSSNATANKTFYNTTIPGTDTNTNTIHGMFMCRADLPPQQCSNCISKATHSNLLKNPELGCYLSKDVVLQNDECTIRYSNHSFFSTPDLNPPSSNCNSVNVSNQVSFERLVFKTMNQVADEAAASLPIKYATKESKISQFQTLYCQAQCTPDLSRQDCTKCLTVTISGFQDCKYDNEVVVVGTSQTSTCYIRYDLYPFYRSTTPPLSPSQQLLPSSNTDHSNYSQTHPTYLSHNCSTSTNETANQTFLSNLKTLFSSFSSNTTTKTGFLKTTGEIVNGLFMCRGDVSSTLCQLCVQDATKRISIQCPSSKEAIIWYDQCFLRYSNRSLVPNVEANSNSPKFQQFNIAANEINSTTLLRSSFTSTLADTLSQVVTAKWESSDKKYGTSSVKLNDNQTLYTLAQCTPDLSETDCGTCLDNIFRYEIPWCCLESPEGKVMYPSCYMMFGLSQFYSHRGQPHQTSMPPSPPPTTIRRGKTKSSGKHQNVFIIVVPIVVSIALLSICCYLLRKKVKKNNYKALLRKNFGDESNALEGLQFDLALIKAATNNFSQENKIGKGGFGEVYKGIFPDGRKIAVKRLLRSSKQGIVEFKTEILLIAKLQHRNLVALIGFCLEEQEKILIYEFVPNGSLDSFLFGTQQQMLSWSQRYKIIGGTALGILYLHEYSRLKVIHRDLKPSNILLDENMNPKISDFGLARIVEIDEDRGNTGRIAGTFGYMSPEYAMFGQFSEKSDVFSFGVIILEIIFGKRNINSYESQHAVENIISCAWREWKKQTPLSILDTNMDENYSQDEVIKCIHMGLLCVQENPTARPSMAKIVSYLNSHSLELPSPQEPAFFLNDITDQDITSQRESSFGPSTNSFISSSINEMTISELYPRE